MEKMDKGTKVKITNAPEGLKQFNGQTASAAEHVGASGETQLFDLTQGGGLFLPHSAIERA
jgi:hypothetical protein